MKKFFLAVVVALFSINAMAQHEIGAVVGGLNGLSYKYWFNDKMALQADLAVGLTQAAFKGGSFGMWDFTLNPNFLYHFDVASGLKIYTGGGVNLGLASDIVPAAYYGYGYSPAIEGKFGVNANVGLAYEIPSAPVVLAFDFRPGYGMLFTDQYLGSFFDWKLAAAVRYKF